MIRGEECRISNQRSHLSQGLPWRYPLKSRSGTHLFLFSRVCSKTVMSWDNFFFFFSLKDSEREVVLGQSIVLTRRSPKLHSGTLLPVTSTVHLLKMSDVSGPDNLTEIYPHCNHVLPLVSRWENGKLADSFLPPFTFVLPLAFYCTLTSKMESSRIRRAGRLFNRLFSFSVKTDGDFCLVEVIRNKFREFPPQHS